MENKILATYLDKEKGIYSYDWLESENDLEIWLKEK